MAIYCYIFILLKQILLCVLLAWIPKAFSARGCGTELEYKLKYELCRPQKFSKLDQMELMQKAFDANPIVVGSQRRRKRNIGPESLKTQVNFYLNKKLK